MQVYYELSLEFSKRMDRSLPFYYFTNNQRFYEGAEFKLIEGKVFVIWKWNLWSGEDIEAVC